jgi:hypothetical protein
VIQSFSEPGDLLLDPYMGGGTSVIEALLAGRRIVGNDLNSLAAFVTQVKITKLYDGEIRALRTWARDVVPALSYRIPQQVIAAYVDQNKTKNMGLVRARFIKKAIAAALESIDALPTRNSKAFARCVLLRVSQAALDGRKTSTTLSAFRSNLIEGAQEMLSALHSFTSQPTTKCLEAGKSYIIANGDATSIGKLAIFTEEKASLIVTSPPYPGVHVLYHRWQVDGRRETPAPYWITETLDGKGASFYNFGDRQDASDNSYFETSLRSLKAIRKVIVDGGFMVQMIAFSRPRTQLPRYLDNMKEAGFVEVLPTGGNSGRRFTRIWRSVPNRKWHASIKGQSCSSREVVLVHRAT